MNKAERIIAALVGLTFLVAIIVSATLLVNSFKSSGRTGGGDGFVAQDCTVTHSTIVAGKDISGTIATSTRRAWARLQVGDNATNTLFASFAQGADAAANAGIALNFAPNAANGSTSTPAIDFGLNTDFPYTGAVAVRSETGTSTVLLTQCVYDNF